MRDFILFETSLMLSKDARSRGPCAGLAPPTRAHRRVAGSVAVGSKRYPHPEDTRFVQMSYCLLARQRDSPPGRATDNWTFERSTVFDFSAFRQMDSNFVKLLHPMSGFGPRSASAFGERRNKPDLQRNRCRPLSPRACGSPHSSVDVDTFENGYPRLPGLHATFT